MATERSIAPAVLSNWVIEALARFEQTDIRTLVDLVKRAPAISGDTGKDAREMVSLRILESLFSHDNETIVNAQKDKISFDASERCEDVLKRILDETPEHVTKLEEEKWNIRPFLMQKRSSLRKCSLQKLKEMILESDNPLLASLKERCKLVLTKASEDVSPVSDDDVNPKKDKNEFQENVLREADQVGSSTEEASERDGGEEREMIIERVLEGSSGSKLSEHDAHAKNQRQLHCNDGNESERIDDERFNFAAKKDAFLNSPLTLGQDLMSEIDLCMRCNEGGQLLICSSESCPLQVHESCLGFDVTLNENEEFLCPFCAYSRSISTYLEAKKKVLRARKNLQAFSSFTVKRTPNGTFKKQSDLEKNETGGLHEPTEQNGDENAASRANDIIHTSNEEEDVVRDPSIPVVDDMHIETEFLNQQTSDLPQDPIPEPSSPKRKYKEKKNRKSTESSGSRSLRKRKAQYVPPPAPLLRRKRLAWTKAEEEILREGVAKYASTVESGIPWKEILDFGRDVFHKDRTNIDLKDKWRNLREEKFARKEMCVLPFN